MKQIVFFTGTDDLYGANRILINSMSLFSGYERVLCLPKKGPLSEMVEDKLPDVKIVEMAELPVIAKMYLNPKGLLKFGSNLIKSSQRLKRMISDDAIIYLNTLAVLPVAFLLKNKKYLHVHEILDNRSLIDKTLNRLSLGKSDKVICVSDAVADNLREVANPQDKEKLVTVHNGILPVAEPSKDLKGNHGDRLKVILIGRIRPQIKGQGYVLDALGHLPVEVRNRLQVIFVGSPVPTMESDLYQLKDRIKEEGLENVVAIHGFTTDIAAYYEDADICLVPSVRADPFPTTVLEGMSAGLPVIGTDIGGIPEMIEDGVTGFTVPPDRPDVFANRLERLISDETLRKNMGKKGLERFNQEFSLDSFESRFRKELPELFEDKTP